MSVEEQRNNPLHGLKAETMINELVDYYGWEILYAAFRINCFKVNPSVSSCLTFLKKTEWARLKVENFYLYTFKRMPKAKGKEFHLKPRERGFPDGILPLDPMILTIEIIEEMQEEAEFNYQEKRRSDYGY